MLTWSFIFIFGDVLSFVNFKLSTHLTKEGWGVVYRRPINRKPLVVSKTLSGYWVLLLLMQKGQ